MRAKKPVTEYGENIFFEILVHDLAARKFLVDFAGVDQLVLTGFALDVPGARDVIAKLGDEYLGPASEL